MEEEVCALCGDKAAHKARRFVHRTEVPLAALRARPFRGPDATKSVRGLWDLRGSSSILKESSSNAVPERADTHRPTPRPTTWTPSAKYAALPPGSRNRWPENAPSQPKTEARNARSPATSAAVACRRLRAPGMLPLERAPAGPLWGQQKPLDRVPSSRLAERSRMLRPMAQKA
eukprot:CAMPEP_0170573444 /NCGR_PEP_ID=MMETSP0224-20130122/2771_1 /TAXON_ID=285029 /ORGANISM="Togula jolla, Strain CCCM 725" /LENGTH=173 /DNA_ID=CAMNT_0010896037 /DNA_START=996 /DNA_END=1515 /DNA_ORIENTATION=-